MRDTKVLITIFVGILIAIAFIGPIANQTVADTSTITVTNLTVTAPAVNSSTAITGRTLISQTGTIALASNKSNSTNGLYLASAIGSDGEQSVFIFTNQTGSAFAGSSVNVSYTAEPDGYQNSSTRPISLLLVLICALALLVTVIVALIKGGSLGDYMRRK